jgi:hypothetical protein
MSIALTSGDVKSHVSLFEDQFIIAKVGANVVAPQLVRAKGVVMTHVVKVRRRLVPGSAVVDAASTRRRLFARAKIEDPQLVTLVTQRVEGVGEERAVGACFPERQSTIRRTTGELVEVESFAHDSVRPTRTQDCEIIAPATPEPPRGATRLPRGPLFVGCDARPRLVAQN